MDFHIFTVVLLVSSTNGSRTWGGQAVFGLFSLGDDFGFSDFAGSGIVHMAGASSTCRCITSRSTSRQYGKDGRVNAIGANLPLATVGTFILWMGWFGFNGGSVLKLGDIANANSVAVVFLNTNAAAAGGAVAAIIGSCIIQKADLTMALNGAFSRGYHC